MADRAGLSDPPATVTDDGPRRIAITIDRQAVTVARESVTADELREMRVPPIPRDWDVWRKWPNRDSLVSGPFAELLHDGAAFFSAPKFINASAEYAVLDEFTVTDEDRRMASEWCEGTSFRGRENEIATLIARIRSSARKDLDEVVDVLGTMVEPLRYWAGYDGLCDRAAAIVKRHREGGR